MTLVLTGSPYGETEPIKATYVQAGHNTLIPDLTGDNSRRIIKPIAARV
jgi:hypothetical protein